MAQRRDLTAEEKNLAAEWGEFIRTRARAAGVIFDLRLGAFTGILAAELASSGCHPPRRERPTGASSSPAGLIP